MANLDALEKCQGNLRRIDSALTLTNSKHNSESPSPQSSRDPSTERSPKKTSTMITRLQGSATSAKRSLSQDLNPKWMTVLSMLCFFISGLVDAVSFNTWNCFVGMQTGNTVFMALGLSGQPRASHSQQWYKSAVSIASYCLGTAFFTLLHRWPTGLAKPASSRRRWAIILSFLIQTLLILAAALLVVFDKVSSRPFVSGQFSSGRQGQEFGGINYLDLCPVALLAFQAAGQVAFTRSLGMIEFPTIVLSTLYHDFVADLYGVRQAWRDSASTKDFLLVQIVRQEKRFTAIVIFFIGAIVGGEMYRSGAGMVGALFFAVGLKGGMMLAFFVWKKQNIVEVLPK